MNKTLVSFLVVAVLAAGGLWLWQNKMPKAEEQAALDPHTVVLSLPSPKGGNYLTDTKGRTLYVFTGDKKLESACVEECTVEWPIFEFNNKNTSLAPDALTKKINVFKRSDRNLQFAFGDQPLYYYSGDKNPGEQNGHGLGGTWFMIVLPSN